MSRLKDEALELEKGAEASFSDDPNWLPRQAASAHLLVDTQKFVCGESVEYYTDSCFLTTWNAARSARMVLYETLLEVDDNWNQPFEIARGHRKQLEAPRQSWLSSLERKRCEQNVVDLASQISNTMPYAFGEIDSKGHVNPPGAQPVTKVLFRGLFSTWHMRMINVSDHTTVKQKRLSEEALVRIGNTMRIRQALTTAKL